MTTPLEARLESIKARHAGGKLTHLEALSECADLERAIDAELASIPRRFHIYYAVGRWFRRGKPTKP